MNKKSGLSVVQSYSIYWVGDYFVNMQNILVNEFHGFDVCIYEIRDFTPMYHRISWLSLPLEVNANFIPFSVGEEKWDLLFTYL